MLELAEQTRLKPTKGYRQAPNQPGSCVLPHHNVCTLCACLHPCAGPPENVTEPLLIFDLLRQEWGGHSGSDGGGGSSKRRTKVFASSFDAFVDEVLKVLPSLNVPVVTGVVHQEAVCCCQQQCMYRMCQAVMNARP